MERVTVYIPKEVKKALKEKEIPMSQLIRLAIEQFLERKTDTKEFWKILETLAKSEEKDIGFKLSEVTGIPYRTIMHYLPNKYKDKDQMKRAKGKSRKS